MLVIGAELISRFVDWEDRTTCVLFGDGAGAVVVQASDIPTGVLSFVLGSEGSEYDALILPAGGSRNPSCQGALDKGMHYIKMDGRRVFKFATKTPAEAAMQAIEGCGLSIDDIVLLIPHQANLRIIEYLAKALEMPLERVYVNIDRYGILSALWFCENDEHYLNEHGDTVIGDYFEKPSDDIESTRLVFYLFGVDFERPLLSPFGPVRLPEPTPMPKRLEKIVHFVEPD